MTNCWRVLLWCVVLGITGCDDDSDTPVPTRTATVLVGATLTGAPATSTATSQIRATATYTPLTCPPSTPTATSVVACSPTGTPTLTGTFPQNPTPTPGLAVLRWFDANPRYTSGVFLPLQEYTADSVRAFTEEAWTEAARAPLGAVADGASLLLISVQLVSASDDAAVQLHVEPFDANDEPRGGLFAVDDQRLVDRSPDGGTIDVLPDGPSDLLVDTVLIDDQRWAFALYRAPRDYEGARRLFSAGRLERLSVMQNGQLLNADRLLIFRPLVIFLHGTGGDTSNWDRFPLWRDSVNELRDFEGGTLRSFYADRVSFQWIALSAGHLADNAATVLPQISRAVERWKTKLNTAATQADVVTHSFGGTIARQVAQTQPDADPLTTADQSNFRAVTNWGHGLIRKLVTLAGSHRGSGLANSTAYLNQLRNGALRTALCLDDFDIAAGALIDQIVLSPALRALRETRLPGHAIIGSAVVQYADAPSVSSCFDGSCEVCYAASGYHGEYSLYRLQDMPNGPYQMAGDLGGTNCGLSFYCENFNYESYVRLANYFFNLDYDPPFTYADCDLQNDYPSYDLTLSACSARGQQPVGAFSTVDDIDPALHGRLSHLQLQSTPAVSERVQLLLEQPTTSQYFAHFAATGAPTQLEEQFMTVGTADGLSVGSPCASGPDNSLINACYNSCNSCEATGASPPCFAEYRVLPAPFTLHQVGQAAPVFVYARVARGPLDGQWTNIQSLANQIWCNVTMTSSNEDVATITTWKAISGFPDQSNINVVSAVADGQSTIELTVENNMDGPLGLTVTVDTTAPAAAPD